MLVFRGGRLSTDDAKRLKEGFLTLYPELRGTCGFIVLDPSTDMALLPRHEALIVLRRMLGKQVVNAADCALTYAYFELRRRGLAILWQYPLDEALKVPAEMRTPQQAAMVALHEAVTADPQPLVPKVAEVLDAVDAFVAEHDAWEAWRLSAAKTTLPEFEREAEMAAARELAAIERIRVAMVAIGRGAPPAPAG